jgi:site-specific DNA-methyltransferase (adenine-specific)
MEYLNGSVVVHPGDCSVIVPGLEAASFDAVVTDPPYALTTGKKGGSGPASFTTKTPYGRARITTGFMGKAWDNDRTAFDPAFWREVLRVLKPGGYLVAFGGTRTYHRLAVAIEDGGFEIRDQIAWAYGSGFPKNVNLGDGQGTALKPAWEPICLARKPMIGTYAENIAAHGTGGLNIDGCRIEIDADDVIYGKNPHTHGGFGHAGSQIYGNGKGVDYKPGSGRFPANLLHDGNDEVLAAFPETDSVGHSPATRGPGGIGNDGHRGQGGLAERLLDTGSAARFFYTAKADAEERIGSEHPTVKPLDLKQWLVRLVTPKGGIVLDPFAGTGTTGEAAWREGMRAVLIEAEPEYQADIARRMDLALNPGRRTAVARSKNKLKGAEGTPLFGD